MYNDDHKWAFMSLNGYIGAIVWINAKNSHAVTYMTPNRQYFSSIVTGKFLEKHVLVRGDTDSVVTGVRWLQSDEIDCKGQYIDLNHRDN